MPEDKGLPVEQPTSQKAVEAAAESAKSSTQEGPFFEDILPSGERKVYQTKDDFAKEWQKSRMLQSDYTRKTQEIAQTRKQYEENLKKFDEDRKAFLENKKRYDDWDGKLKSRPDVERKLREYLEQPENPAVAYERAEGLISEKEKALMDRIEQLENRFKEGDSKREIEDAFAQLKGEFPDADEDAIMERLREISDGDVKKLIRQLYYSHKGQLSPAQVERKVTENLRKKEDARMVPTGASHRAPPPKFTSIQEAREAAMAAEGLTGG
jgi:hypothetical protein